MIRPDHLISFSNVHTKLVQLRYALADLFWTFMGKPACGENPREDNHVVPWAYIGLTLVRCMRPIYHKGSHESERGDLWTEQWDSTMGMWRAIGLRYDGYPFPGDAP